MLQQQRRKLFSLARRLRRELYSKVAVRMLPVRADGDCSKQSKGFRIRIAPQLEYRQAVGTLLHEFAHVLSWGLDGDEPHGEFFKEARSKAFDVYLGWRRENED